MTDISLEQNPSASDGQALREKAVAAKEAVVDLAGEAKRYAAHRAADARDKVGELVENAKSRAGDMNDQLVDQVQRHPYKAIAIAAGVGLLVGLLLKRR